MEFKMDIFSTQMETADVPSGFFDDETDHISTAFK
jgi:hypothetical protein